MPQYHNGIAYTDIMVDVETTGVMPDRAAIVQIGARRFNMTTGDVDTENNFKASLTMLEGRAWEEGTRNWWKGLPKAIQDEVFNDPMDGEFVLNAFADWCFPSGSVRFWAKPTHFDYMFLQSHFTDLGIPNPFHFRTARDMNSYVHGLYKGGTVPEIDYVDPAKLGGAHDAMNDVDSQINYLLAHIANTK